MLTVSTFIEAENSYSTGDLYFVDAHAKAGVNTAPVARR